MLPSKGKYAAFDVARSAARLGVSVSWPDDFLSMAKTTAPLRALHFVKRHYSPAVFQDLLQYLFYTFFTPPNRNISNVEVLEVVLAEAPVGFSATEQGSGAVSDAGKRLFSAKEVKQILDNAEGQEMRDVLKQTTAKALELGAFGAPWMWVTDSAGRAEPFFGSDR